MKTVRNFVLFWAVMFAISYAYGTWHNYNRHIVHTKEGAVWYYEYNNDGVIKSFQVK